jgi:hypothetical protein
MITTFSNGAISQGIVKYTSEYETIEICFSKYCK